MGRSVLARGLVLAMLASSAFACGDDGDSNGDGSSGDGQGGDGDGQGGDGQGGDGQGGDGQGGDGQGGDGQGGDGQDGDECAPPGTGGGNCTEAEQAEFTSCLKTNCGDAYTAAFGPDAFEGDFSGGACGSFFECLRDCDCGQDFQCLAGCGQPSGDCTSAGTAVSNCQMTNCPSPCAEPEADGSSGGDGSSGTACADLATCCAALDDANLQAGCDQVVSSNLDNVCEQALTTYQATGDC